MQEAESDRQVLVTAAMRGYVEVAARMLGVYWPSDWQARAVLMDGEQRARARKRLVNGGCRLEDRARWTPMMAAASTGQVRRAGGGAGRFASACVGQCVLSSEC